MSEFDVERFEREYPEEVSVLRGHTDTNKFGSGFVHTLPESPIYFTCSACMSVWADALSWANANPDQVVRSPEEAKSIVVLACQVTDLAVLNDLRTLERLMKAYPTATFYVGGCLAYRFDIQLPDGVRRLRHLRKDYQLLNDLSLVHYETPFWVPGWKENDLPLSPGHLFRDMYPLRISVGCKGACTYCTIRITRGEAYNLDPCRCLKEFELFDNVVLTADSPTEGLLGMWIENARKCRKPIAIRNVEPVVALVLWDDIATLSSGGLLSVFHCPVQHGYWGALREMGRSEEHADQIVSRVQELRRNGTVTATNVIIDYKDLPDDLDSIRNAFDVVSWNPYWDGVWDRALAEERFAKYIGQW